MNETYISVDIESDGPIPGPYSLISLGAIAFQDGDNLSLSPTYYQNIHPLENATTHPKTMKFWEKNDNAYQQTFIDRISANSAMHNFYNWCNKFDNPVAVCFPAGFDFTFVYWYFLRFVGKSPFSFSALDMKTYASQLLNKPYRETRKANMPKTWFPYQLINPHHALCDAISQAYTFQCMLNYTKTGVFRNASTG